MFDIAYLKRRLGQYGATWVAGFLVTGLALFVAMALTDLIAGMDLILPVALGLIALTLGAGVVATLVSDRTVGTKLAVLVLALLLALPLLWAPVSAAVTVAFFADRSIEYSGVYAAFQIGISRILYPLSQAVFGAGFDAVWAMFQGVATVVGFFSALASQWPRIRRLLGPEPEGAI